MNKTRLTEFSGGGVVPLDDDAFGSQAPMSSSTGVGTSGANGGPELVAMIHKKLTSTQQVRGLHTFLAQLLAGPKCFLFLCSLFSPYTGHLVLWKPLRCKPLATVGTFNLSLHHYCGIQEWNLSCRCWFGERSLSIVIISAQ